MQKVSTCFKKTPLHCITRAALVGLLFAGFSGCATLSEGECKTADWQEIGRKDGSKGYTRARLHKHYEACAEYKVEPQADRYYAGRDAGLKQYCTPRKGFDEGREGNRYRGVCPPDLERGFLAEFSKGEMIHEIDTNIETVERDISRKEQLLSDDDTSSKERLEINRELRELYDKLRELNRDLFRLERLYLLDL
ncbi:DUF2799 domain-containing protein [Marinobacter salexigens]|uniref:DUF2799 domain-containing protein n=1 Tax=Marinobacter salexigens TaxID=1925763 RepID=A0ABS6A9B3_9GAMM|nr:DUF2799 domain-containing protein [Marinobacter salexigens]MBU2874547.1 DUF2799 domain-containing protein [Marinobacter salexigens]